MMRELVPWAIDFEQDLTVLVAFLARSVLAKNASFVSSTRLSP